MRPGVRRSHSSPSLTRRFPENLSTATIIHCTDFKSRPSIPAAEGSASLPFLRKQGDISQGISDSPIRPGSSSLWPYPSITTVETAAAAKIFFEIYYNTIFFDTDLRPQRLGKLEEPTISPEERLEAKHACAMRKSDHLRQARFLKTRSDCT
jgi:hypothetical protein